MVSSDPLVLFIAMSNLFSIGKIANKVAQQVADTGKDVGGIDPGRCRRQIPHQVVRGHGEFGSADRGWV